MNRRYKPRLIAKESELCGAPHPDNGNPGAVLVGRGGMIGSHVGGMFCERTPGHEGVHACNRRWETMPGWGEQQQWGGGMGDGEWKALAPLRFAKPEMG